jgi:sigma-E factor negative regulatory protein RseC
MIEETAQVIEKHNDVVLVKSKVKSSCSACHQSETCGSGQIAKAFPQKSLVTTAKCDIDVDVGDTVIISLPEKALLTSAWQVYCLPLLGLVLGGGVGQWFLLQQILSVELVAVLLSLIGGYVGFKLARFLQHQDKVAQSLQPVVVKVLPSTIPVTEIH